VDLVRDRRHRTFQKIRYPGSAKASLNADSKDPKSSENLTTVTDQSDAWLLRAWKTGNEQAAEVLFNRYAFRLISLVSSRLNRRFRSEIDPDEVVQSAMGSFFEAARVSRIEASGSVSLWRLLATFARRKMARRIEKQLTVKRGGDRLRVPLDEAESLAILSAGGDRHDDASEFLRVLNSELPEELLSVVEGLLAGQTQGELAKSLGIDERTVRRRLTRIRELVIRPKSATGEAIAHRSKSPPNLPSVSYSEFVLGKLIGSGGFGKVYRASMQCDGRTVAVKFLRKVFWQNESARASFLREINLASQIEHPGVIRYLGYGESPHGGPYLLSQWIDGRPLHAFKDRTTAEFIRWMIQVCDAVQAVHDKGLVHGDLTPANILIDQCGKVTITDFGFSQSYGGNQSEVLGGTLGFAAPEQIDSAFGNIGPRTDIYAIGGLIYWHFCGRPPNAGASLEDVISETVSPDDSATLCSEELPKGVREVLNAALRKCAADRTIVASEIGMLLSKGLDSAPS